jgi:hypothetical protein
MAKKIIIFSYEDPQPPTITSAAVLVSLGYQVLLVTLYCPESKLVALRKIGVECITVLRCDPRFDRSLGGRIYASVIARIFGYTSRLSYAQIGVHNDVIWNIIAEKMTANTILWIASAKSALALGKKVFNHSYILHILELYEWEKSLLSPYARKATAVIVPDVSRAAIHKVWMGLKRLPSVIPNKPFNHPRTRCMTITDKKLKDQVMEASKKPIVIYQGVLDEHRPLEVFASVMNDQRDFLSWVIIGEKTKYLDKLYEICPSLTYLGYIPAPEHLEVTSYAAVGVIQYLMETEYSDQSLNRIFCAPNKVWEYAGFNIPSLAPDFPSLRMYYDRFHAGEICDMASKEDIKNKLNIILGGWDKYTVGCRQLYDSADLAKLYQEVIDTKRVY